MREPRAEGEPYILVAERSSQVHFLWGFLTAVSVLVLVLANRGDTAGASLVVVNVLFGVLLLGSVFAWIWFIRNPGRLEISNDEIALRHGRRGNPVRFFRDSGDLYVRRTMIGGKTPLHFLMSTGSDDAIALETFHLEEIQRAAAATGWRFVEDPRR